MRENTGMRVRSFLACLLGLLLAAQPALAASKSPGCAHHDRAAVADTAADHHGHHAGMDHGGHEAPAPMPVGCECDCRGALAGCAHATGSVAMGVQAIVFPERLLADAPIVAHAAWHASTRLEPPLRPPIHA